MENKKLKNKFLNLIIPLTIISMWSINKWWYVSVEDGTDEILTGFPLPFVCRGFHTSMSLQIFTGEFLIDFLVYFSFWWLIIFLFTRYTKFEKLRKWMILSLRIPAILITVFYTIVIINPNNIFSMKRTFNMEIMDTGTRYFGASVEQPDYYKYHPERRPK